MSIKVIDQAPDELTYRSYAFNRQQFPKTAPERWARIFPNQSALEERFRREAWESVHRDIAREIFH